MNLRSLLAVAASILSLASCVSISSTAPESALAGCGGGIDRSITAKIEANYAKALQSGTVGTEFSDQIRAAFNAEASSKEKYDSYLACFKEVDARVRKDQQRVQCNTACEAAQSQCLVDQKAAYDQCLRKGQASCRLQCATVFNLSKSQCTENCDPEKPSNIGTWEQNHNCVTPAASHCSPSILVCKSACAAP